MEKNIFKKMNNGTIVFVVSICKRTNKYIGYSLNSPTLRKSHFFQNKFKKNWEKNEFEINSILEKTKYDFENSYTVGRYNHILENL